MIGRDARGQRSGLIGQGVRGAGIVLALAIWLCVPALAAGQPQFRLDMDNPNLQAGASGHLVVSMVDAQGASVVSVEGLDTFDVLSQSQSTSITTIQGEASYQEDIHYTIMPTTTGQFTLKAIVQYNGQRYETNTLDVTVGESPALEGEAEGDLFVKTVLSHREAYLGEKIVLTYELYSLYNIENYGFTDFTTIDGVVAKDMPEDRLKAEYVYLEGVRYVKYEAKQLLLDPIKSGAYTIPSFNMQVNVITGDGMGGGIFGGRGGGFFNFSEPMYLRTDEAEITVKPLPSEGKPADFSGIVGQPRLDGHYSREEMDYGDSLTLQGLLSGSCNLDGLKNILPKQIPGFTVYETQKNTTESVEDNRYHVQREFEAILVPETTGVLNIAPLSLSYFDPVTETYERTEIPGVAINVLGEVPHSAGDSQAAAQTVKIDQVNYTEPSTQYVQIRKETLFGVLIGLAVLAVLAIGFIVWRLKRKKQDPELKTLYRRLKAVKDVNEIYSLFNDMCKHCLDLSVKASSRRAIQNSPLDAGLAERVVEVMDYMESSKAHEEKGDVVLKEKIGGVYRLLMAR